MAIRSSSRPPPAVATSAHSTARSSPGPQPVTPADDLQPYAVGHAARRLAPEVLAEQSHEPGNFYRGPPPVVRGEGEQREDPDASVGCRLHHSPHRAGSRAMSRAAGKPLTGGPATVAVHDN